MKIVLNIVKIQLQHGYRKENGGISAEWYLHLLLDTWFYLQSLSKLFRSGDLSKKGRDI